MGQHSDRRAPRAAGIGRSLRLYHGDADRVARMRAHYAMLVPAGGLAFDIGAHVGDRTSVFRRLGARVVAVEPQPAAMRALRLIHGRDPGVTLVAAALGAEAGKARMRVNSANPTVSTLSDSFVAAADGAAGWQGQHWDGDVEVPVTTLDALIAAHGVPDFTKIDVEGLEDAVLAGLTRPLPCLSFEVTMIHRQVALRALQRLATLGPYRVALSLGESFEMEPGGWRTPAEMGRCLEALPDSANSGDVYAALPAHLPPLVPGADAG
jgi:FkbM family methyltransferase